MKTLVIILSVLIVAVVCIPKPDDKYTTKYDSVNIDDILSNDRLLDNYMKCILEKGKCTPDGAELKKVLPDALKTECSKCSPPQKDRAEKVIRFLANNKRNYWDQLIQKYDPSGEYKEAYAKFAQEKGIKL